jgi:predicted transcriptional regulator
MIPIEKAMTFRWGISQGKKLMEARESKKLSMAGLSMRIKELRVSCSDKYINKLEKGLSYSVSTEIFLALITVLEMDIEDF